MLIRKSALLQARLDAGHHEHGGASLAADLLLGNVGDFRSHLDRFAHGVAEKIDIFNCSSEMQEIRISNDHQHRPNSNADSESPACGAGTLHYVREKHSHEQERRKPDPQEQRDWIPGRDA
jgi:hypothetical protein